MLSDGIYRLRDFPGTTCALRMGRAFAIGRGPCAFSRPLASRKFSRLNAVVSLAKSCAYCAQKIIRDARQACRARDMVKVADATVPYCRPCERPPWGESWGANDVLGRKVHTRTQTHPVEHMRDIGAAWMKFLLFPLVQSMRFKALSIALSQLSGIVVCRYILLSYIRNLRLV